MNVLIKSPHFTLLIVDENPVSDLLTIIYWSLAWRLFAHTLNHLPSRKRYIPRNATHLKIHRFNLEESKWTNKKYIPSRYCWMSEASKTKMKSYPNCRLESNTTLIITYQLPTTTIKLIKINTKPLLQFIDYLRQHTLVT